MLAGQSLVESMSALVLAAEGVDEGEADEEGADVEGIDEG